VKVRTQDISLVAAPVTVVDGGRRFAVYVRKELSVEAPYRQVCLVVGSSAVAGGFSAGEEGFSDEACWAEDAGRSSYSSVGSERWHGEEVTSVRAGMGEGDNSLHKTPILEQTSPPRFFGQENTLSNPSILLKSVHGEDEDSDRRRKVSLEREHGGSACNKGTFEM